MEVKARAITPFQPVSKFLPEIVLLESRDPIVATYLSIWRGAVLQGRDYLTYDEWRAVCRRGLEVGVITTDELALKRVPRNASTWLRRIAFARACQRLGKQPRESMLLWNAQIRNERPGTPGEREKMIERDERERQRSLRDQRDAYSASNVTQLELA